MSCKKYLTVKELEAALEDALDDLERDKQIDAVYIPPDVDSLTDEETIDDESPLNEDRFHGIDSAGTFEMHLPDFDSSDEETLASKRQGPPTTKQDSNISDVPDREEEQSDSSDDETLASKRARLNQSIPNHADNVPQWARGEIEYTYSPMDNEKKNKEHLEAELSGNK